MWETESGRLLREFVSKRPIQSVALSPDGKAAALMDKNVTSVCDVAGGKTLHVLKTGDRQGITWSPDGKSLAASGGIEGQIYDADSGRLLSELPTKTDVLAYSPGGKHLAFPAGGRVEICQPDTSKVTRSLDVAETELTHLVWSPDGKTLAAACRKS